MDALQGHEILRLWDLGQAQQVSDPGALILSYGLRQQTPEEIDALLLGQRNALLLKLRAATFGDAMRCSADCPACHVPLSFSLSASHLASRADAPSEPQEPLEESYEALRVRFRLLRSGDVTAIASTSAAETAAQDLFARCLVSTQDPSGLLTEQAPPPELLSQIGARMLAEDPLAEILLNLRCVACGESWKAPFNVASCFFEELMAHGQRLLEDVLTLGRACGWRVDDVLALPPQRRRFFVEAVSR